MEDKYRFTSASDWFYCPEHEEDKVNININDLEKKGNKLKSNSNSSNNSLLVNHPSGVVGGNNSSPNNPPGNYNNGLGVGLSGTGGLGGSTVNVSVAVGRIIIGTATSPVANMAPVTTFCATVPNNRDSFVLNNLNRAKSLDNLNFEEKRQIIASTLSLADILSSQGVL